MLPSKLAAISNSPTDPHPVFAEIAESAARLCEAYDSVIPQADCGVLRLIAHYGPITTPDQKRYHSVNIAARKQTHNPDQHSVFAPLLPTTLIDSSRDRTTKRGAVVRFAFLGLREIPMVMVLHLLMLQKLFGSYGNRLFRLASGRSRSSSRGGRRSRCKTRHRSRRKRRRSST
jgi:hypothetical protein